MRLGDKTSMEIEVIPSGNILIDRALGVGGFPRGRVVEIFGPESRKHRSAAVWRPLSMWSMRSIRAMHASSG
jgi:RecA/RadA recombinase